MIGRWVYQCINLLPLIRMGTWNGDTSPRRGKIFRVLRIAARWRRFPAVLGNVEGFCKGNRKPTIGEIVLKGYFWFLFVISRRSCLRLFECILISIGDIMVTLHLKSIWTNCNRDQVETEGIGQKGPKRSAWFVFSIYRPRSTNVVWYGSSSGPSTYLTM